MDTTLTVPKTEYSPRFVLTALIIFGGSFLTVYFLPGIIAKYFFVGLFAYAFRSRQYGVLAVFYLVLLMNPLYLFRSYDLPIYNIIPGISLGVFDIMGVILLIKALNFHRKFLFSKPIVLLLVMIVFYFISSFFDGSDFDYSISSMRKYFFITSYFVFSAFLEDEQQNKIFLKIALFIALLSVLDQFLSLLTGKYLMSFLTGKSFQMMYFEESEQVRSFSTAFYLVYLFLIFSFRNVFEEVKQFRYNYWLLGIFSLSILLSGTRQWFINLIILFSLAMLRTKKLSKTFLIPILVIMITFMILIVSNIINLEYLLINVLGRYETLITLTRGDLSQVTARMDDFYNVLYHIKNSLPLGMGFRADTTVISNDIGGFFNAIARFGILGGFLFSYFFVHIIKKTGRTALKHGQESQQILYAAWVALFVQFLYVYDYFSFTMDAVAMITLLLAYTEINIRKSLSDQLIYENSQKSTV
ncbi:MAG: hypothetical protein JXB60_05800 [Candidatus Cloacimonetes bacterium]|nr:hypothetical protein [Candidatus Cloacimonadota bacterium]